jgi:hypothetical protein
MRYLTILDYTTGTTIIEDDPAYDTNDEFDYDDYIYKKYGKIEYYYMIGSRIDIKSKKY